MGGAEFQVRRLQDAPLWGRATLDNPQNIVDYLTPMLRDSIAYRPDVENLIVVHLSTRKKPIGFEVISNGTLDTLFVHSREVFRSAILANSAAIVICHNHPSGDPTPSDADIKCTRDLMRAGQLLKIELVDHVILGQACAQLPDGGSNKGWSSLRELGYFYN